MSRIHPNASTQTFGSLGAKLTEKLNRLSFSPAC